MANSIDTLNIFSRPIAAVCVTDANAGLPRAGFEPTDFSLSIDTRDASRLLGVRYLREFFSWAQPLIDDIGPSAGHWISSIAFSGIGCPE